MKKLLSVLVVLVAGLGMTTSLVAQVSNRGADDSNMEAAQRSVENQLVVEEMENAGFELDVEEGFDEEWEEDLWVGSEAEDVDPIHVDPSEAAKYDLAEVPAAEEIESGWSEDSWENPDQVIDSHDDAIVETEEEQEEEENAEVVMRGEATAETEAFDLEIAADLEEELTIEEEVETAELNWWEEEDSQWEDIIDDMESYDEDEAFEEEEDLDLLEELYYRG
jgi:hypothetical protein